MWQDSGWRHRQESLSACLPRLYQVSQAGCGRAPFSHARLTSLYWRGGAPVKHFRRNHLAAELMKMQMRNCFWSQRMKLLACGKISRVVKRLTHGSLLFLGHCSFACILTSWILSHGIEVPAHISWDRRHSFFIFCWLLELLHKLNEKAG